MPLLSSLRSLGPLGSLLPSRFAPKAAAQPTDVEMTVPAQPSAGPPPGGIRGYAHHVESALALLRGDTQPPLAELLCSDADSDRHAGLRKLDALLAPGGPVSALPDGSHAGAALQELQRDGWGERLPPPEEIRRTLQSVSAELDAIAASPASAQPPEQILHAARDVRAALAGAAGRTTADLLNSFKPDDRIAGNARLDELLQHLQVLSHMHRQADPDDRAPDATPSAPPEVLVGQLRQFVLAAGHAMLPERRTQLLECKSLGLPLDSWFEKCDALVKSASEAFTALKARRKPANGEPGREFPPPKGKSFARVADMAKSARDFVETAAPAPARSRQAANHRVAVRGPVRGAVRNMSVQEASDLYRRMRQAECRALHAFAVAALAARQQVNEGSSEEATRIAAECRKLEEWIAAYEAILEALEEYTGLRPEDASSEPEADRPETHAASDGDGPASAATADASPEQLARAREMFKTTFGFAENARPGHSAPASAP